MVLDEGRRGFPVDSPSNHPMITRILHDGTSSCIVTAQGFFDSPKQEFILVDVGLLSPIPRLVRVDGIQYAIENGVRCYLWWDEGKAGKSLIAPLFGQGKLEFSWFSGLRNPQNEGCTGNIILSCNDSKGAVLVILDLEKQS